MKIAIIGAGAAGCFAAIEIKRRCREAEVTVYESGRKALAKVAVTGGGRCLAFTAFLFTFAVDTRGAWTSVQAEIIPMEPDTGNADAGICHNSAI